MVILGGLTSRSSGIVCSERTPNPAEFCRVFLLDPCEKPLGAKAVKWLSKSGICVVQPQNAECPPQHLLPSSRPLLWNF